MQQCFGKINFFDKCSFSRQNITIRDAIHFQMRFTSFWNGDDILNSFEWMNIFPKVFYEHPFLFFPKNYISSGSELITYHTNWTRCLLMEFLSLLYVYFRNLSKGWADGLSYNWSSNWWSKFWYLYRLIWVDTEIQ